MSTSYSDSGSDASSPAYSATSSAASSTSADYSASSSPSPDTSEEVAAKFGVSSVVAKVGAKKKFRILSRRVDFASPPPSASASGSASGSASDSQNESASSQSDADADASSSRRKRSSSSKKRSKKKRSSSSKKKKRSSSSKKKRSKSSKGSKGSKGDRSLSRHNKKVGISVLTSRSTDIPDTITRTTTQIIANISDDLAHADPTVDIASILDVQAPKKVAKAYHKTVQALEKARPFLARNNFVTKRLYHGTHVACDIGLNGNSELCNLPECNLCNILRFGFNPDLSPGSGTKARAHPSLLSAIPSASVPPVLPRPVPMMAPVGSAGSADDPDTLILEEPSTPPPSESSEASAAEVLQHLGPGIYFSSSPTEAEEYATLHPSTLGRYGRRAVLVAQVAVGRPYPTYTHLHNGMDDIDDVDNPESEYDSIKGVVADVEHPDGQFVLPQYVITNPAAALVTQVVVYTSRRRPLCPRCGLGVYYPERAARMVYTKMGVFCSKRCGRQYAVALRSMRSLVARTPRKRPDEWFAPFWEKTDSDEPCVMVDLWQGSLEWTMVELELKKTLPNASIARIYRVQNEHLYNKYVRELKRVRKNNGNHGFEKLLFHGTSGTHPSEIYESEDGFDFRYSTWGMWGLGAYFAAKAAYSNSYSYSEPSGHQTMFIAKVITGDAAQMEPDSDLKRPPKKSESYPVTPSDDWGNPKNVSGARKVAEKIRKKKTGGRGSDIKHRLYDTVTGFTGGSRVYISYNFKAYPAYLVTYKMVWDEE